MQGTLLKQCGHHQWMRIDFAAAPAWPDLRQRAEASLPPGRCQHKGEFVLIYN